MYMSKKKCPNCGKTKKSWFALCWDCTEKEKQNPKCEICNEAVPEGHTLCKTHWIEKQQSRKKLKNIEYVKNETDGDVFSEEVINAIATLEAADLTPRVTAGDWGWKRRQELLDEFETIVLPTAMGINRSQQYHEERPNLAKYSWLGGRQYDEEYD